MATCLSLMKRSSATSCLKKGPQTLNCEDPWTPTYVRQFLITRDNRRKGIGKLAFNHFVAHLNPDRLLLDVKVTNPVGQRFWESLGFVAEHIAYQRDGGK